MNKGWIVWIALIVIVVIVAYIYTGLKFPSTQPSKSTSTSTIAASTTAVSKTTALTTVKQGYLLNCSQLFINGVAPFSSSNETCQWQGGKLGVWAYSGFANGTSFTLVGKDGKTYASGSFNYNATTFYTNVTLPKQNYTVTLSAGSEGGHGTTPFIKLNQTVAPPPIVYSFIYNANFSDGKYTGWNVSGSGFGTAPFNLAYANSNAVNCYQGSQWRNYPQAYFATTFTCGILVSPGNLTSEAFRVNPKTPFLNFKIISPDDSLIYVEAIEVGGNTTVVGHFNTYNISFSPNVSSTFANVSLPLTTLANKIVKIRVVAATIQAQRYVAVGGFSLGSLPKADGWVTSQVNITR